MLAMIKLVLGAHTSGTTGVGGTLFGAIGGSAAPDILCAYLLSVADPRGHNHAKNWNMYCVTNGRSRLLQLSARSAKKTNELYLKGSMTPHKIPFPVTKK